MCCVLDGLRPTKPSNAKVIGFGSGTWELVKECWKEKSKKRPTIERVLAHLAGVTTSSTAVGPILKDPPDPQTVLLQWERLGSLDRRSRDYYELLGTLVDVEGNGAVAMEFTGGNAEIVMNIIDEVSFCDVTYLAVFLSRLTHKFSHGILGSEERWVSRETCPSRLDHALQARRGHWPTPRQLLGRQRPRLSS